MSWKRTAHAWCGRVNARVHRESAAVPGQRLAAERRHLHPLPADPYVLALGEERLVNEDQTVRFGSVRYSTPPGHVGDRVWCRVHGSELVIVARDWQRAGRDRPPRSCPRPAARGSLDEHYPHHPAGNGPRQPRPRPRTAAEEAFLSLGEGAARWLTEAAAAGTQRVRSKMARAVELAAVVGAAPCRRGARAGRDHGPVRRRRPGRHPGSPVQVRPGRRAGDRR